MRRGYEFIKIFCALAVPVKYNRWMVVWHRRFLYTEWRNKKSEKGFHMWHCIQRWREEVELWWKRNVDFHEVKTICTQHEYKGLAFFFVRRCIIKNTPGLVSFFTNYFRTTHFYTCLLFFRCDIRSNGNSSDWGGSQPHFGLSRRYGTLSGFRLGMVLPGLLSQSTRLSTTVLFPSWRSKYFNISFLFLSFFFFTSLSFAFSAHFLYWFL